MRKPLLMENLTYFKNEQIYIFLVNEQYEDNF